MGRKIAKVAVARAVYAIDKPYDYLVPRELELGLPGDAAGLAGHHVYQLIAAGHLFQQVFHCGFQHHNKNSLFLLSLRVIAGRLEKARVEFREIPNYDYLVINDKVSGAVAEIEAIPLKLRPVHKVVIHPVLLPHPGLPGGVGHGEIDVVPLAEQLGSGVSLSTPPTGTKPERS